MPPCERVALVATRTSRLDERDPHVVDAERVLLKRSRRLRRQDYLAPRLRPTGDHLDRIDSLLSQVPQPQPVPAARDRRESGDT